MTLNELIENFNKVNLAIFLEISGSGDLNELYTGKNPYHKGKTLLAHILFLRDKPALIKLLSIRGDLAQSLGFIPVDINRSSCWGDTPLCYAIYAIMDLEIIQILLENGAEVNQINPKNLDATPLMEGRYRLELVGLLIQHKANIDAQDMMGRTVLMKAVSDGHDNLVELLIVKGADLNIKDNQGNTAFIKAKPISKQVGPKPAPMLASQPYFNCLMTLKISKESKEPKEPKESKESPVNTILPPAPEDMIDSIPPTPKIKRKRKG